MMVMMVTIMETDDDYDDECVLRKAKHLPHNMKYHTEHLEWGKNFSCYCG